MNKLCFFVLLSLISCASTATQSRSVARQQEDATSLFKKFPHSETFMLSNGQKVPLPVQINYNLIALRGIADLAKLNSEVLKNEDLAAIPDSDFPTKATIMVYFVKVHSGDAGTYDEIIVSVPSQSTNLSVPKQGEFIWQIQLNGDLGRRYGVDVWGYPKVEANVRIEFNQDGSAWGFNGPKNSRLTDLVIGGSDLMSLSATDFQNQVYGITPYKIRRSWITTHISGKYATRPFDPSKDVYSPKATGIGKRLLHVRFEPKTWIVLKSIEAVTPK